MIRKNFCLLTDSYKEGHHFDYPHGTQTVYSYMESRGGIGDWTLVCGLQYQLKEYFEGVVITQEMIEEAEPIINAHMGPGVFNRNGFQHIVDVHGGKLPLEICAVPEGTIVNTHNAILTIRNTDPECYWLTNYCETLLMQSWYPTTVATISRMIKNVILEYLEKTGDPSLIDYKLNDFGFRGTSSVESAGIGDFAHLLSFKGTDTLRGLYVAGQYYGAHLINPETIPAHSLFATEHSIICSFGPKGESDAYRNFLENHPTGLIACVSDTYDIYNACANLWGGEFRDMINARNGTLVVRPDSGDPVTVVCKVIELLGEKFGYELNNKGFKVLNPHVRVIQGDGVNQHSIRAILQALYERGWSADNIAFGMGGALLQQMNRDTFKFAIKASYVAVMNEDGVVEHREIFKLPTSDTGKASKAGQLALSYDGKEFRTVRKAPGSKRFDDHLVPTFLNGDLLVDYDIYEIKDRSNQKSYANTLKMGAFKEL